MIAMTEAPIPRNTNNGSAPAKASSVALEFLLETDPALEDWRVLAAEWYAEQKKGRHHKLRSLDKFIAGYIHDLALPTNPYDFLRRDCQKPQFWDWLKLPTNAGQNYNNYAAAFLDWVLQEKLSVENDHGAPYVSGEYHNPIRRRASASAGKPETHKTALPYRYICELRSILAQGPHFRDWIWAQQALGKKNAIQGDWYKVDPSLIDQNDPDCVWRRRSLSGSTLRSIEITEIWSPVRAVTLYIKLLLPLRAHQVRMLDSGEGDTWRYEPGSLQASDPEDPKTWHYTTGRWRLNDSRLGEGTERRPSMRGVFHRSAEGGITMTGLYINTNKTADISKDETKKGYIIPWQNEEALYWLAKVRDWQQRYNSLSAPVPWSDLIHKHFGDSVPHPDVLTGRGRACFLFRDPAAPNLRDCSKPLSAHSLERIWRRLLEELEKRCETRGETLDDGSKIRFVVPDSRTATHFPLHALRVSLITAYALEGGVPFPILSKLIVGHARLIMTLYYTKVGKAHVTEVMREAERNLLARDAETYRRFLQDASYQQIEERFAMNDPAAAKAASQQKTSAVFYYDDKGICPMGATGCDVGGPQVGTKGGTTPLHASVPGYPLEKNCMRCRFFITGPAFTAGLVAHFNHISYQLSECAKRYTRFEKRVDALDDKRRSCESESCPFPEQAELERISRLTEQEAEKADKLANDLHATLRLIERCRELLAAADQDGIKLVPAGGISDVGYALEEIDSELHQLEVICENAVVFPEGDTSKPTLRRSQILDAMLEMNGRQPVFFKLTPEQQLLVGNQLMQLIQARVGNLRNAVEVGEGKVLLSQLGLLEDTLDLVERETGRQIAPVLMGEILPAAPGRLALDG